MINLMSISQENLLLLSFTSCMIPSLTFISFKKLFRLALGLHKSVLPKHLHCSNAQILKDVGVYMVPDVKRCSMS